MRYRLVANTKLLIEKQLLNDRSRSSKGGVVLCPTLGLYYWRPEFSDAYLTG